MADAADLKSVVRKDVRVRLPPSAPNRINNLRIAGQLRLAIRFAYRDPPGDTNCSPDSFVLSCGNNLVKMPPENAVYRSKAFR